jgi:hypothetical protein
MVTVSCRSRRQRDAARDAEMPTPPTHQVASKRRRQSLRIRFGQSNIRLSSENRVAHTRRATKRVWQDSGRFRMLTESKGCPSRSRQARTICAGHGLFTATPCRATAFDPFAHRFVFLSRWVGVGCDIFIIRMRHIHNFLDSGTAIPHRTPFRPRRQCRTLTGCLSIWASPGRDEF